MTNYSDAAKAYAGRIVGLPPLKEPLCAAFDAGAASVVPAEPITTYRQPERVLTTSEFLRTAEDALVRDKHGNIRSIRSARVTDDGPYTLVYDPTWPASPPVAEPVLLTADDPRIKPGAWVAVTHVNHDKSSVTYRYAIDDGKESRTAYHVQECVRRVSEVLLLAEAPDPDADVVANLVCELVEIDDSREWTTTEARRLLAGLRERGVAS